MPAEIDETPSRPAARAFAAVLLVTVVDLLFNRATGRPMPLWAAPREG
ncbi:hypothetical protein Nm8I071_14100 [Nonomuraea sp. TT08I-71]|nr:hypothetical protein Nm8I071_14100 [Nonomuraea sp. TT08I-71]